MNDEPNIVGYSNTTNLVRAFIRMCLVVVCFMLAGILFGILAELIPWSPAWVLGCDQVRAIVLAWFFGLVAFRSARRIGYPNLASLSFPKSFKVMAIGLIPLYIAVLNLFDLRDLSQPFFDIVLGETLVQHLIYTLGVGFNEEFAFRSLALALLFPIFGTDTKGRLNSSLLASLSFGLIHLLYALFSPDEMIHRLAQCCGATCIGMCFCGILLYTRSILLCGICHFLINFAGGLSELYEANNSVNTESAIFMVIICLPLYFFGRLLILRSELIKQNQRVDPTVKTPVESGKVQGTAGHP